MAFTRIYGPFIDSMLELRSQRLKEALAKQEAQEKMGAAIGAGISQLGSGIASGIKNYQQGQAQARQNTMANTMMNRMDPPSATAVNPEMQQLFAGQSGAPHTGGTDELAMGLKMGMFKDQQISAAQQRLDWDKSKYVTDQAEAAEKQKSAKLTQGQKDYTAYIKQEKAYKDAMIKAKSPEEYENAVDALIAHNHSAVDFGLKQVQPIDRATIAPFMSADDKMALKQQQANVALARTELQEAQKAPPGVWDRMRSGVGLNKDSSILGIPITFDTERTIENAQQKFEAEQKALREMPGGAPRTTTTSAPQNPTTGGQTAGGGTDTVPLEPGTRRYSPSTKRTQQWNGKEWVDI